MLAALGQIDAFVRCRHGLELVHVGANGIHQDLARENGVLGNRGTWSWLDAIGLIPTASNTRAPIMMLIRRPGRRSRCVTRTIRHLHEFACISPGTRTLDMRSGARRWLRAAHNRQVAETSLRPREETAPFASQLAASCFMVFWKYHVTTKAMITSVNFTSNMPSARYCSGFVSHSVTPLTIWHAAANQMNGTNLFIEVYGIVRNSPNRRRPMINVKTYDRRRSEGVDRQRERPTPGLIDPFRIRGMSPAN